MYLTTSGEQSQKGVVIGCPIQSAKVFYSDTVKPLTVCWDIWSHHDWTDFFTNASFKSKRGEDWKEVSQLVAS